MTVREKRSFRVEAAPEGVCPECLRRLGTGLATYERDWRMYGSQQEWHVENAVEATIELISPCRLTAEVAKCDYGMKPTRRAVIWKPGDVLRVQSSPGGSHYLYRALVREGDALPDRDLKHVVIENDSRKGDHTTMLCTLEGYRLAATPADVLLAKLHAAYEAEVQAEADETAKAEAKRRAEQEERWRKQVADHMAGESIKAVAALLSAQRHVAAVGARAHFGDERTVRVGATDAIKLSLAGSPELDSLSIVLSGDEIVSSDDETAPDRLVEPIVRLELKQGAAVAGATWLAMKWGAREGAPVDAVAQVVRTLLAVGVPRRLVEDVSLARVGAVGLAGAVLAKVDELVDEGR
jgi:hypothetical protein